MTIRLLAAANRELAQASEWYCERDSSRGFLLEVDAAQERIVKHPHAWGSIAKGYRRCRVLGYPYGLIYYIHEESEILVVSVFHLNRKAGSWRANLD